MTCRRSFLKTTALAALGTAAPPALGAAASPAPPSTTMMPVRRIGDLFAVDGWILTARDLEALGLHNR
jgi:hypothetical protein